MEEVLKTRGLRKAINFLEKLHQYVLRKAMITLAKPAESTHLAINSNDTKEKASIYNTDWQNFGKYSEPGVQYNKKVA
jgi:hypothetical protein